MATVNDYPTKNKAPDKVEIEGTRIPICGSGTRTEIRDEGPRGVDYCRYSAIQSRVEWNGNPYVELLRGDGYKEVKIHFRNPETDEFQLVHEGYVGAWGGSDGKNLHLQVQDVSQLLNTIYASVELQQAYVRDYLDYVKPRFEEGQPLYDTLEIRASEEVLSEEVNWASRSWRRNQDHIGDILEYVSDRAGVRFWFEGHDDPDTTVLRVASLDTLQGDHYRDYALGGTVDVLENHALAGSGLQNTLTVAGSAVLSRSAVDFDLELQDKLFPPRKYVEITVEHEGLVSRANGRIGGRIHTSNFAAEQAVRNYARSKLRRIISQKMLGEITTVLDPRLTPHTTLEAKPVTANITQTDVTPLTWEIKRAILSTSQETKIPASQLTVGVDAAPEDIAVVDTTWRDM